MFSVLLKYFLHAKKGLNYQSDDNMRVVDCVFSQFYIVWINKRYKKCAYHL